MATTLDKTWIEKTVTYTKCPKCASGVLDTRIPRGKFVKYFFFWLKLKRFKCNTCEAKVYIKTQ